MLVASSRTTIIGLLIAGAMVVTLAPASAHAPRHAHPHQGARHASRIRPRFAAAGARVIQCVAFAKSDAGIDISGNARDWWPNAEGVYERGARPEAGSVLSFRANGRMPLGHVAVVSAIDDSRTITIDQSHWNSRGISRDIVVKDVSEENDWTAVRVQLGTGGAFGSIYPTHGFIYPRPDRGTMVANDTHAPIPVLDEAPADLRRSRPALARAAVEIAEAPESARPLDMSLPGIASDAPSRTLR